MIDPVIQRDRINALDKAYRALKSKGGQYRDAWQRARMAVMETGSWELVQRSAAMDELIEAAQGFRE